MKFKNILRSLPTCVALASTPACTANIADAQRASVQRALEIPVAANTANTGTEANDDAAKRLGLAPDSPEAKAFFAKLEARFSEQPTNYKRPRGVSFYDVRKSLEARPDLLWSLSQMERTGGQPDVIDVEDNTFVFADVTAESPEGRRDLTYDQAKKMAGKMRVAIMDKDTYLELQEIGNFDLKTVSWILTTKPEVLQTGGVALDGGCRDGGSVCVYQLRPAESPLHSVNGALTGRRYSAHDHAYVELHEADDQSPLVGWRGLLEVPKLRPGLAPDSPKTKALLAKLEARFSKKASYRPDVVRFADVRKSLEARPDLLWSLSQMERTGGQPDVIDVEDNTFVFADVTAESPEGRRDLTYDQAKKMADEMGIEMMDEDASSELGRKIFPDVGVQNVETESWLLADSKIVNRCGGARLKGRGWLGCGGTGLVGGFRGLLRVPRL